MLFLIISNRNMGRIIKKDVCCHKNWVRIKTTTCFFFIFSSFSLNWVILFSHPILATQLSIHAPSAWADTFDWLKIILFLGSIPLAINVATVSWILFLNSLGSCLTVIACKSTTQNIHSFAVSLFKSTKFLWLLNNFLDGDCLWAEHQKIFFYS